MPILIFFNLRALKKSGPEKGGHCERGLFTGGSSRISKFSRISRKWSASPCFPQSGESLESPESLEHGLFMKRPLFQKTPFSEPDKASLLRTPSEKPSQNPSSCQFHNKSNFENLLRTLLRSVLLHDPLGAHPISTRNPSKATS